MSFCAVCCTDHDLDIPCCSNKTEQLLRDIGIERGPKEPSKRVLAMTRRMDRVVVAILVVLGIALAYVGFQACLHP